MNCATSLRSDPTFSPESRSSLTQIETKTLQNNHQSQTNDAKRYLSSSSSASTTAFQHSSAPMSAHQAAISDHLRPSHRSHRFATYRHIPHKFPSDHFPQPRKPTKPSRRHQSRLTRRSKLPWIRKSICWQRSQ